MANFDHQILVAFCDAEESVQDEISYADFNRVLDGEIRLERYAATTLKSVFCVVGQGLRLKAFVNFVINVDERGRADPGFNVPLMYLAEQAGVGADLGEGEIRVATRGRCAVPWHSLNLWEAKSSEFVERLQRRIYRNRLNLQAVVQDGVEFSPGALAEVSDLAIACVGENAISHAREDANDAFTDRLEEVFGASGKLTMQDMIRLHSEQLAEAKAQYRRDVEEQQTTYLAQIREVRDEVYDLKVALRQERDRNRRLQQMLRGDP